MTSDSVNDWLCLSDMKPDGFVESDFCESSARQSLRDMKTFMFSLSTPFRTNAQLT
jgi:hypothetical protein